MVGRNITERKRAEETLMKAREELELRMQERTAELADANEKLRLEIAGRKRAEEALGEALVEAEMQAAKGILAAEIAHDINNSLASIQTSFYIINNIRTDDRYRRQVSEDITRELNKIAEVVKSIFEMYHQSDDLLEAVDINEEVLKVIRLTQRRLEGKGIAITTELARGLTPVMCFGSHVRQVLLNLIRNAEDALASAKTRAVTINTWEEGDFVKIEVKDTGCGINKEKLDDMLSDLHSADAKRGGGLPICRMIAREYGGDIMVQSEEGMGTTVTVAIPKGNHG